MPLYILESEIWLDWQVQLEMPETEVDKNGLTRVKFRKDGWNFWTWRGHKVHYIKAGNACVQCLRDENGNTAKS